MCHVFLAWTMTSIAMLKVCCWPCSAHRTSVMSSSRGTSLQPRPFLTHPLHSHTLTDYHSLNMLCSFASWGFCEWCVLSWFICLDIVFSSFKTAAASPVGFCWLSPGRVSGRLRCAPHHLMHTSMEVLLITVGTGFPLDSEPLDYLNWTLFFLVLQVPAVIPGGLNTFFEWIHFRYGLYYFLLHSYKWDHYDKIQPALCVSRCETHRYGESTVLPHFIGEFWYLQGILEPTPHRYWGTTVPTSSRQMCALFSVLTSTTLFCPHDNSERQVDGRQIPLRHLDCWWRNYAKKLDLLIRVWSSSQLEHFASWDARLKKQENQEQAGWVSTIQEPLQMEGNSSAIEIAPSDYKHMSGRLFRESLLLEGS